ncbi:hypothetical protein GEV33_007813 [Tenebrio molitor]|uniref:Homeobox domain-containing protein n=1 Tax=Tenebrio molitor TaxID=7067 RepID=A0A8J6HIH0_TENMO|nr:hypothetical protein GEV33_007813 [Tenebrio molitor]
MQETETEQSSAAMSPYLSSPASSRSPSPKYDDDDEISVGCPSPSPGCCREPEDYFKPLKRLKMVETERRTSPTVELDERTDGVKSFSIVDILNHKPAKAQGTRIVRPWDIDPDVQRLETLHRHLKAQQLALLRPEFAAFNASYASETGSDRSSSVASDCCSPDIVPPQRHRQQGKNPGATPLDALFQMTSKTFDSSSGETSAAKRFFEGLWCFEELVMEKKVAVSEYVKNCRNKKMNVDGVDSDSEIDEAMIDTPPDIANEALQNKTYFRKNLETSYGIENRALIVALRHKNPIVSRRGDGFSTELDTVAVEAFASPLPPLIMWGTAKPLTTMPAQLHKTPLQNYKRIICTTSRSRPNPDPCPRAPPPTSSAGRLACLAPVNPRERENDRSRLSVIYRPHSALAAFADLSRPRLRICMPGLRRAPRTQQIPITARPLIIFDIIVVDKQSTPRRIKEADTGDICLIVDGDFFHGANRGESCPNKRRNSSFPVRHGSWWTYPATRRGHLTCKKPSRRAIVRRIYTSRAPVARKKKKSHSSADLSYWTELSHKSVKQRPRRPVAPPHPRFRRGSESRIATGLDKQFRQASNATILIVGKKGAVRVGGETEIVDPSPFCLGRTQQKSTFTLELFYYGNIYEAVFRNVGNLFPELRSKVRSTTIRLGHNLDTSTFTRGDGAFIGFVVFTMDKHHFIASFLNTKSVLTGCRALFYCQYHPISDTGRSGGTTDNVINNLLILGRVRKLKEVFVIGPQYREKSLNPSVRVNPSPIDIIRAGQASLGGSAASVEEEEADGPVSARPSKAPYGQNHLNLFNSRQQPKKKRKSRTAFTNHQIFELEKRFLYQKYLSPADRDEIASSLGLTNAQVITWFQNRRAKLKRDMEELKKDVESAKLLTAHKSFLENVQDLGILKKKAIITDDDCPKNLVVTTDNSPRFLPLIRFFPCHCVYHFGVGSPPPTQTPPRNSAPGPSPYCDSRAWGRGPFARELIVIYENVSGDGEPPPRPVSFGKPPPIVRQIDKSTITYRAEIAGGRGIAPSNLRRALNGRRGDAAAISRTSTTESRPQSAVSGPFLSVTLLLASPDSDEYSLFRR